MPEKNEKTHEKEESRSGFQISRTEATLRLLRALNGLPSGERMTSAQLAAEIGTSERNIREYVKELQHADFPVSSGRGAGSGYCLERHFRFPSVLDRAEINALNEAERQLQGQEFPGKRDFLSAVDKINTSTHSRPMITVKYIGENTAVLENMDRFLQTALQAIRNQTRLLLRYRKRNSNEVGEYALEPYDIISDNGVHYLLARKQDTGDFRLFRFSPSRMLGIERIPASSFVRDPDYKMQEHVGKNHVFAGPMQTYAFAVVPEAKTVFEEEFWSPGLKEEGFRDGYLHYTLKSDQEERVLSSLLSLGPRVRVLSPAAFVKRTEKTLKETLALYTGDCHAA